MTTEREREKRALDNGERMAVAAGAPPTRYKVNSTPSREVAGDAKQANAEMLAIGPYRGGPITNEAQLRAGLEMLTPADNLLKEFRREAKVWVDANGPIAGDGREWGPSVTSGAPAKVNMTLDDLQLLMYRCGSTVEVVQKVATELEARGIGTVKSSTRYGWSKL